MEHILQTAAKFRVQGNLLRAEQIFQGHINRTYRIFSDGGRDYILQRINTNIFRDPVGLTANILGVTQFLREKLIASGENADRGTLTLIETQAGGHLLEQEDGFYRMYYFIHDATSHDVAVRPILFRNAAAAFGRFQRLLADYPAETLSETIPNFHNTPVRYQNFLAVLEKDPVGRAAGVKKEIDFFKSYADYFSTITDALTSGKIPLRVTHNDTKLNNIMMDNTTDEGVCVIDLDTVMPGSLLYDFGDSIRFGASTAKEDEKDLSKVSMNLDLYRAYTEGFLSEASKSMTAAEADMLADGAIMMTLECGMRFLTDYLDGDQYFALHYDGQNLDRARTQIKLVQDMEEKRAEMDAISREIYR